MLCAMLYNRITLGKQQWWGREGYIPSDGKNKSEKRLNACMEPMVKGYFLSQHRLQC